MNKKKILLTAVAMILVCVMSIMGTVAYLQDQTQTVTNTFVAAGGPGPFVNENGFELLEYKVEQSESGAYTQTAETVAANSYKVLQGTTIPKQAFVKLERTGTVTPAPAYLYLEVVDGLDDAIYTWEVDTSNWEKLDGFVGPNNGTIYVYCGTLAQNKVLTTVAVGTQIDIVLNDCVTVADVALDDSEMTLSFNAYLTQASIGSTDVPADVFKACFTTTDLP